MVDVRGLVLGHGPRLAGDHVGRGRDPHSIRIAPGLGDLVPELAVDAPAQLERGRDHEDQLAPARREAAAPPALTGLDDDGMALGRGRHGERAARAEEHALVVEPMDLRGIGEDAALAVEDDRVVLPRVPVAEHRLHELVGAVVAGVVLGMARPAEVGRLGVVQRRDHVPGRAAADHVVERREDAGHVKRLVVRRRVGAADAEVTRGQPHRGEERDQVELDHADAVAHGFGDGRRRSGRAWPGGRRRRRGGTCPPRACARCAGSSRR